MVKVLPNQKQLIMKKLFTLLLLSFTTIVFAQENEDLFNIEKGTWVVEGGFSIFSENREITNDINSTNDIVRFSIMPRLGYTLSDNLVLGLGIGYSYSKLEHSNERNELISLSKTNSISFTPYLKKFFPLSDNLALNLQAETSYERGKRETTNNSFSNDTDYFFIGLRPGVNYSMSDNFLLQASFGSLGYSNYRMETNDVIQEKSNSFGLNLGTSSLLFGVLILL